MAYTALDLTCRFYYHFLFLFLPSSPRNLFLQALFSFPCGVAAPELAFPQPRATMAIARSTSGQVTSSRLAGASTNFTRVKAYCNTSAFAFFISYSGCGQSGVDFSCPRDLCRGPSQQVYCGEVQGDQEHRTCSSSVPRATPPGYHPRLIGPTFFSSLFPARTDGWLLAWCSIPYSMRGREKVLQKE